MLSKLRFINKEKKEIFLGILNFITMLTKNHLFKINVSMNLSGLIEFFTSNKSNRCQTQRQYKFDLAMVQSGIPSILVMRPELDILNTPYFLYILFLVLSSAIVILFFGRFLGRFGALCLNLSVLFIGAIYSILTGIFADNTLLFKVYLGSIFNSNYENSTRFWQESWLNWSLSFDFITLVMFILVLIVSCIVNFYAYNYLLTDPHLIRFFSYLAFFTFFMLFLVSSDSLIQFFFAWEGVGICSYLLIGFWSTRIQANKAAIKAVIVNKIGDVALLFTIAALWMNFNITYFSQLLELNSFNYLLIADGTNRDYTINTLLFIGFCGLFAAVAKSAQLGLHTWLPDAMEGPTPVSALIHAATMVTAGILFILRLSPVYSSTPAILIIMTLFGVLTTLLAGFIAIYQTDLKKTIAYSTCSQLGYMFFACGLSFYSASLFHLVSHGFFKALLFLVAGAYIHAHLDEQSSLKLYIFENRKVSTLLTISLYIGLTALVALPFFSGFYSKEYILIQSSLLYLTASWVVGALGYNIGLLAAVVTALYSAAMLEDLLVLNAKKRRSNMVHTKSPFSTRLALIILSVLSIIIGSSTQVWFIENANLVLNKSVSSIFMSFSTNVAIASSVPSLVTFLAVPLTIELLPLVGSLIFTGVCRQSIKSYLRKRSTIYTITILSAGEASLRKIAQNKFWFDYAYNACSKLFLSFSYKSLLRDIDKGALEFLGPTQVYTSIQKLAFNVRFMNYNMLIEGFGSILFIVLIYFLFFI